MSNSNSNHIGSRTPQHHLLSRVNELSLQLLVLLDGTERQGKGFAKRKKKKKGSSDLSARKDVEQTGQLSELSACCGALSCSGQFLAL